MCRPSYIVDLVKFKTKLANEKTGKMVKESPRMNF